MSSSNPLSLATPAGDPQKDKLSLVIISLVEQLAAAYEQEDERRVILAKCNYVNIYFELNELCIFQQSVNP